MMIRIAADSQRFEIELSVRKVTVENGVYPIHRADFLSIEYSSVIATIN